jgi:two-component system chemotaxis response regulator CheB
MCSSLTERGAAETLEALSLGATDYVTKPSGAGRGQAPGAFAADLVAKLNAVARRPARPVAAELPRPAPRALPRAHGAVAAVAIGVSTGGPNALAQVIPELPADLPVPVLIVQHMPPIFTRMLAERLAAAGHVPVCEARAGAPVEPGVVYVAPGDQHMRVARQGGRVVISLDQGPPENSCRPAVDPLFESVAEVYGGAALGVVLTGMGRDGLRGAGVVRAEGGAVLAQDERTSVVWGMPGYVVSAGLADEVLPLERVASAILRRVRAPQLATGAA